MLFACTRLKFITPKNIALERFVPSSENFIGVDFSDRNARKPVAKNIRICSVGHPNWRQIFSFDDLRCRRVGPPFYPPPETEGNPRVVVRRRKWRRKTHVHVASAAKPRPGRMLRFLLFIFIRKSVQRVFTRVSDVFGTDCLYRFPRSRKNSKTSRIFLENDESKARFTRRKRTERLKCTGERALSYPFSVFGEKNKSVGQRRGADENAGKRDIVVFSITDRRNAVSPTSPRVAILFLTTTSGTESQ